MNQEWIYPDNYKYLNEASQDQFAWEFLRRNNEYKKDFEKYRNYPSLRDIKGNEDDKNYFSRYFKCVPPIVHKESYNEYMKRVKLEGKPIPNGGIFKCWARRGKFISKYDLFNLNCGDMSHYNPSNINSPGFFTIDKNYPEVITGYSELSNQTIVDRLYDDEVLIRFNVLQSLNEQIEKAKSKLKEKQKKLLKTKREEAKHSASDKIRLICCIRILDAIEAKATEEEIIFHIYRHTLPYAMDIKNPEMIKNNSLKLSDDEIKRIKKRVNENMSEAINLRDGNYLEIVKSPKYFAKKIQGNDGEFWVK